MSGQRAEYADMLAAGVPENVIAEFDGRLTKYIDGYKAGFLKHFKEKDRSKTTRPFKTTRAPRMPRALRAGSPCGV